MLRYIGLTDVIWYSNEAHISLIRHVNKQNMLFWGTSKPDFNEERPLHSQKVTVWAALSSAGIIGSFFYEEDGKLQQLRRNVI